MTPSTPGASGLPGLPGLPGLSGLSGLSGRSGLSGLAVGEPVNYWVLGAFRLLSWTPPPLATKGGDFAPEPPSLCCKERRSKNDP